MDTPPSSSCTCLPTKVLYASVGYWDETGKPWKERLWTGVTTFSSAGSTFSSSGSKAMCCAPPCSNAWYLSTFWSNSLTAAAFRSLNERCKCSIFVFFFGILPLSLKHWKSLNSLKNLINYQIWKDREHLKKKKIGKKNCWKIIFISFHHQYVPRTSLNLKKK